MKEFNLGDLAQLTHDALPESAKLPVADLQKILETAFDKLHENCIGQVTAGAKVGRFEQNFGKYPFVVRLKKVEAKTSGFGPNGVPARYSINVRVGKGYPKPE